MVFKDEETRMRLSIKDSFHRFIAMLETIKKRNDIYYREYRKKHHLKKDRFEQEVREQKEIVIKEMPINSDINLSTEKAFQKIQIFKQYLDNIRKEEQDL